MGIDTEGKSKSDLNQIEKDANVWIKQQKIRAFYSCTQDPTFLGGAKNSINLVGAGKLKPNMVLLGFKGNWHNDLEGLNGFIDVIHHGYDGQLAVGILRIPIGSKFKLDIDNDKATEVADESKDGSQIAIKQGVTRNVNTKNDDKSLSPNNSNANKKTSLFTKQENKTTTASSDDHLFEDISPSTALFQNRKKPKTIDVWWLSDDGGLSLLLPYILSTRGQFSDCRLRVFTEDGVGMISMLARFRIQCSNSDVEVITGLTKDAQEATRAEFKDILSQIHHPTPDNVDFMEHQSKTNKYLRITELLRQHSSKSKMVIMTQPILRKGGPSNLLFMSWLEIMTRQMPPFLLVRGNQTDVLTFYS